MYRWTTAENCEWSYYPATPGNFHSICTFVNTWDRAISLNHAVNRVNENEVVSASVER